MIVHIPRLLEPDALRTLRETLESAGAAWVDGRATAGYQGAPVKRNEQIAEGCAVARTCGERVLAALERMPLFISAVLPARVYPPLFNRYAGGQAFGDHVDGAIRLVGSAGDKVRTDVSATLFLSAPEEYDGGELVIRDTYGEHAVKLPAGDLVVYSAHSVHRVTPVTRGTRLASFFWVQSLVRDDACRTLLFELDGAIQRLNATGADETARRTLIGCYHNLLRQWSDT
jgi:PKHD-type hydroxylase